MPWGRQLADLEPENQLLTKLMDTGFKNITATLFSDDCNIVNEVPESIREDSRQYQCYIPDFTSCTNSGNYVMRKKTTTINDNGLENKFKGGGVEVL